MHRRRYLHRTRAQRLSIFNVGDRDRKKRPIPIKNRRRRTKMSSQWQIPRRTFLKGLGATIALPVLDAMVPVKAFGKTASASPLRLGVIFVPNGAHMQDWTPATYGADFELPRILKPLQPVKNDLLVLTGLTHDKGRPNGDGPGDHARSASSFLTGAQPL